MQRRYLPITILTGILLAAALVGYLIPASSEGPPVRVLLDNKGGNILFAHQTHSELQDQDCAVCHHTSGSEQSPPTCTQCHVKKFDEAFVADHQNSIDERYCVSCHHATATIGNFSHDTHVDEYATDDCQACHHDATIEPEPQACSDCHEKESTKEMLSLRQANHTRCADCHDALYKEGIKGCRNCHTREMAPSEKPDPQPCSSCHSEPVDQLVPTTMAAFHAKCMGCHEKQKTGPFGDDACYQCHMK